MQKELYRYSRLSNLLVWLPVLLFITEAYFKIVLFSSEEEPQILQVTKAILLAITGGYILFKRPKSLFFFGLLSVSFLIGQWTLSERVNSAVTVAFIKLLYPIVLLLFFDIYSLSIQQREHLFRVFEYIMLINALIIFIGFLFDLHIFSSYPYGDRFGYNGLFVTSATSSYVYGFTLIYFLAKYRESVFANIPNLIIIASMFFLGTKLSLLLLACFF